MKAIFSTIFLFVSLISFSQSALSYYVGDYSWKYSVVTPPGRAKGLIIFIPGFTQTSEATLNETEFQNMAYKYGLSTIIMPCGSKLFADGEVVEMMNEAINKVMKDHDIPKDKVVIGGFSIGGSIALRYTEYSLKYKDDYPVEPQAVFLVDSPTDLVGLYQYCEREIMKNYSQTGVEEAKFAKSILDKELGGSPETKLQTYKDFSPYTFNSPHGGNISVLKKTAVRSYHDADVNWQLKNRRRGYMGMNATLASEMISDLLSNGNEEAELIIATGKGIRQNGERHPHAMSIVNEQDLITWILNNLDIPMNSTLHSTGESY